MKKILVISAHPDDEVLGLGGTIAWHSKINKDEVSVVIITEGCSTQYQNNNKMISQKKVESEKAAAILGVKNLYFEDLPDMKLDSLLHVDVNIAIEKYINKVNPDIVFTHHPDINKDHVVLFESSMVALRPLPGANIKKVFTFAPLSSTEWSAPFTGTHFIPNVFYDISETLQYKLDAFSCYRSETRDYPHPRSLKAIATYAERLGIENGVHACEPFMLMRSIENK